MSRSPFSWKETCADEDVPPPKKRPTLKTLKEMFLGRRFVMLTRYEETMPPAEYAALKRWINGFMP